MKDNSFVENLLSDARQRDETAFGRLIDLFSGDMFKTARAIRPNIEDAEDAVQDASLKAWKNLYQFTGEAAGFGKWLCAVTRNVCINSIAKNCAKKRTSDECYDIAGAMSEEDYGYWFRSESKPVPTYSSVL